MIICNRGRKLSPEDRKALMKLVKELDDEYKKEKKEKKNGRKTIHR